ncbi:MAG: hypothetical protein AMDU5_GPLC00009G0009 [Thermoplasmatales archaeon Gpl]|nr:MAG: hypothetical protein AMDU5_GPLC00009G0009 [Thermoplasmatales archaeon Gpl]
MSMKGPISFVEEKVKERAKETSNIKSPIIFDMDFKPPRILIRSELNKVTNDLADYVNPNLPGHIIIYGSKGSGKTLNALTITSAFGESNSIPFFYVNARENRIFIKIYRKLTRIDSRGQDIDEVKSRFDAMLSGKSIVILDEVDFLQDYDILYHFTRHTRTNPILLTQKVYWYMDMNDESVKSSLQPDHIVFHEYSSDEIGEILKMRALTNTTKSLWVYCLLCL